MTPDQFNERDVRDQREAHVFLDGAEVTRDCRRALCRQDGSGVVERYRRSPEGLVHWSELSNAISFEVLEGKVRIERD